MFSYTVAAEFDDLAVADEWLAWMRGGHLQDVCDAGAIDAEAIRVDTAPGDAARCEARYHFASREAFARYERDHAPRLRAEGLARFPASRGVRYVRSTGEVVASTPQREAI
jgi:hypothetical protein